MTAAERQQLKRVRPMTDAYRQKLKRDRRKAGLVLVQEWVPAVLEGKVREAIEALMKPAKPSTEGKWVPNDDLSPLTNIHGRRWRVVGLHATTTGTYTGPGTGPDYMNAAEWFFPSVPA